MNTIFSIIVLTVMIILTVVSFWVLFKGKTTTNNAVVVPSYNETVEKILNEKYLNDGNRPTQKRLLDNTDYVLNALFN
jgi:hypothetical protein